jgi:hypothetical protein
MVNEIKTYAQTRCAQLKKFIYEEIKRRLNSGNICYHLVQKLFSSRLLPKNVKINVRKTIILSVILYGCEI